MNSTSFAQGARKYSLPIAYTVLAFGGMLVGSALLGGFQAWGIKQQVFILLTIGLALLLWDHSFFWNALWAQKTLVSLAWACLGFVLLLLVLTFPGITILQPWAETLPNILVLLGLVALFRSAYLRFTLEENAPVPVKLFWLIVLVGLTIWLSSGLFSYILVCMTSLFVGRGLSRLLGLSAINQRSLTPFLALVFWSILIGFGVGIGIPMKIWSILILAFSIGLAWWEIKQRDTQALFERTDILILLIPFLIVFPYTIYGLSKYAGNPSLDGWNYIASGQFLWEMSRCSAQTVLPIYKFGSLLSCYTRYISFGFLAFLSPLAGAPGDTQISASIYIPWVFFVYASTLRFFAESRKESGRVIEAYIVLGALAGWPLYLMVANNFDNLLFISYLPAISGLVLLGDFSLRWNVLMGAVVAAVFYTYPELAPFVFLAITFFAIERWHVLHLSFSKAISAITLIFTIALFAVAPYLQRAINFLVNQLAVVYTVTEKQQLPGGSFASELVNPHTWFVALWGMGGVLSKGPYSGFFDALRMIIGFGFLLGFLLGITVLWRRREFGLLSTLAFFASAIAYYLIFRQYGYAGYKLLNISWWLIAYLILMGCLIIYRRFDLQNPDRQWIFRVLACSYLIWCYIIAQNLDLLPIKQIAPYRALASIPIPDRQIPLISVVRDSQAEAWAIYYWRNKSVIYFPQPVNFAYVNSAYFVPEVDPPPVLQEGAYLLIDRSENDKSLGKLVWENSVYKLVELSKGWIWLEQIDNPNRVDNLKGRPFFWMSSDVTRLKVQSDVAQIVRITFIGTPGPDLPDSQECHMRITSGSWSSILLVQKGTNIFSVPVESGENTITLEVLEQPSMSMLPSGDGHPLMMLSVLDLNIGK